MGWFHRGRIVAPPPQEQISWRRAAAVAVLGMLFAGFAIADRVGLPDDIDLSAPFTTGAHWGMHEAVAAHGGSISLTGGTYGYDGQWYLGMAYDPLLRGDIVTTFDRPQYRAQRPLYAVAGYLAAGGQPVAIPFGLLLVQILGVGLGCAAVARIATAFGRSRWWGATFALIPGVVVGIQFGTAEPLGLAFSALGLSVALTRRYLWSGVAFAAAGLTKETYLAFAAAVGAYLFLAAVADGRLRQPEWLRSAVAVILPGIAAFAAWWLYVAVALPSGQRTPNQLFVAPLSGWWEVFGTVARNEYVPDYPIAWGGGLIVLATLGLTVFGLVAALMVRRTFFAYAMFIWGGYALLLVGILLERFLSAQRALAPTVLAVILLLFTVPWLRQVDPSPAAERGPSPAAGDPDSPPVSELPVSELHVQRGPA